MANKTIKTTDVSENIVETVENTVKTETVKEKKVFKDTDPILCESITPGELGMIGIKTGINYLWAGRGDVTEVEYQDLVAGIRSGKKQITTPCFIIKDDEFLKSFPQISKIYNSMYSTSDLEKIFELSPTQMKKIILSMPEGVKKSLENIASSLIIKGKLDSVQRIKILDEIFDTQLIIMTDLLN